MADPNTPTRVTRFDAGIPIKAVRLDNGHLKVPATLGRVGVLVYQNPDGSTRREFRPPEELFAHASLASLELAPVTLGHPKTAAGRVSANYVDDRTTKTHAVGVVGERFDTSGGVGIDGSVKVYDERGIKAIDSGTRELSPGYDARLDATPGVYNGEPYDFVQRDIRYNHVAIVRAGRAGSSVRLHLDEADDDQETDSSMVKLNIGGVDFEVSEQAAQAFKAEQARQASALTTATARADSLEAELTREREQRLDEDALVKKIREGVDARVKLEREAAAILGAGVRLDSLDERGLMVAVVTKASPGMTEKLKDASADYVKAAYDFAVANHKPLVSPALKQARADAEGNDSGQRLDADAVRRKHIEEQQKAWMKPLPGAATREGVN